MPHGLMNDLSLWILCVLVAQSRPTLCNPMDCSPPGSSVHGILQARILEWIAIPFSRGSSGPRNWTGVSYVAGRFFIPRTIGHQSPLSTGFSRKEYWGGFPCPPPGYLPNSGIKPMFLMSPALAGEFFSTSTSCEAHAGYAGGQFF